MGMGNINKMLKQAQKMQAELARIQEEAGQKTLEASSGGGAVKVMVNGNQELLELIISPDVIDPQDPDMLQDLVMAAVNEGLRQARDMVKEEMGRVTGGMKLPGVF